MSHIYSAHSVLHLFRFTLCVTCICVTQNSYCMHMYVRILYLHVCTYVRNFKKHINVSMKVYMIHTCTCMWMLSTNLVRPQNDANPDPWIRIQKLRIRIRILVNVRTNLIHSLQVKNFQSFLLFYSKKYLADIYLLALRTRIALKTSSFSQLSHKITFCQLSFFTCGSGSGSSGLKLCGSRSGSETLEKTVLPCKPKQI